MFGRAKAIFKSRKKSKPSSEKKTVQNLGIGDVVSYYGQDFIVKGSIKYSEGGDQWFGYRLVEGDEVKWLGVEEDDGLELTFWEKVKMRIPKPVPDVLNYEGEEFELEEHGHAKATLTEESGNARIVDVEYWDFEGKDENLLSVERWGEEYEVSVGSSIDDYDIEVYPGSLD